MRVRGTKSLNRAPVALDNQGSGAGLAGPRVSHADLQNLIDSAQIAALILERDLSVRTFTGAASTAFGLSAADIGRAFSDLQLGLECTGLADAADRALRQQTPFNLEASGTSGTEYDLRFLPYTDAGRNVSGVAVIFTDVTRYKKLANESRRFAAAARSSDDALVIASLDGRVLHWNKGAERLYGFTATEVASLSLRQAVVPEEFREENRNVRERLCRGEHVEPFETKRLTKDGRLIDVWVTATAITDETGRVDALAATVRDITDRKRSEAQLREAYEQMGLQFEKRGSELAHAIETVNAELANRARVEAALTESQGRIRAILDTAAEGIISIDKRGTIDSFNPAAERIFGYPAAEVIGRNVSVLMPPPDQERHDRYLSHYLETREKKIIGIGREVVGLRKDGTTFPMDLAVGEGVDGDGPIFTGIIRDLTARKESENVLRSSERLAAIGTLAAGLGHDMNNVLLPVRAHLNALCAAGASGALKAKDRKHVDAITRSAAYLQQLADGLHFLVMDPEKSVASDAMTDLHGWWTKAGTLLSKAIPKHIKLSVSIPAGLPPVNVEPHQLTQAVLNLLVNSGEAIAPSMLPRRGRIQVWAKADRDAKAGPCVRIGVTDSGQGMSEDVRRKAFDMFFTTKPRGMGTGLGLPLVRRVVDGAGGSVEIKSSPGKGTTVSMAFAPCEQPKQQTATKHRPSAVVTIGDGRAGTLVTQVLDANGARTQRADQPAGSDIWVVEPSDPALARAGGWRKRRPDGRLVLFGEPDAGAAAKWTRLRPIIVTDPYNVRLLREALARACNER